MRSRVSIKSHPLHPILVSFPIAFLTGAFLCDAIFILYRKTQLAEVAIYLEAGGIFFAVLAAIPGIIDYSTVVPPNSSAKKRAMQHGLLNSTMFLIFIMALLLRRDPEISMYIIVLLEGVGVSILTIAGWMGGTLVIRNQIGVDHRYAHAGKWKEETIHGKGRIELKELDKLKINQMKLIHINGKRIVVGRSESEYLAFDDFCTHRGGSLADGAMICGTVQCPWHGSQFSLKTGAVNAGPAERPITTYPITVAEGKYYLTL